MPVPYEALCILFDEKTNHGSDMGMYDVMLTKALTSLATTFRKRAATGLQTGRSFILPDEESQVTDATELELVTWTVVKSHE